MIWSSTDCLNLIEESEHGEAGHGAEVFANREFQEFLASIPSENPNISLWDKLVDFVRKVLGIPKDMDTMLHEALSIGQQIIQKQTQQNYKTTRQEPLFSRRRSDKTKEEHKAKRAAAAERDRILDIIHEHDAGLTFEDMKSFFSKLLRHPGSTFRDYIKSSNKDMTWFERNLTLPYFKQKADPGGQAVWEVQEKREEDRNTMRVELLQNAEGAGAHLPGTGTHEYLEYMKKASKEDKEALWAAQVEADAKNINFTEAVLKNEYGLNDEQIHAFRKWHDTMERMLDIQVEENIKMVLFPYEGKPFYDALYKIVKLHKNSEELQGKAKAAMEQEEDGSSGGKAEFFNVYYKFMVEEMRKVYDETAGMLQNDQEKMEFGAAFKDLTELSFVKTIFDYLNEVRRLNYYIPRLRDDGKYAIRVYEKTKESRKVIWHERAGNVVSKAVLKNKLQEQFADDKYEIVETVEAKTPESVYQKLSSSTIQKFIDRATDKSRTLSDEDKKELRDGMLKAAADALKERGFMKHQIKRNRELVGGYIAKNLDEIFVNHVISFSGIITKQKAAREFGQALSNRELFDLATKPMTYEYWANYVKDMLRNDSDIDRLMAKGRAFMYTWYITGKLSLAAMQITQNYWERQQVSLRK